MNANDRPPLPEKLLKAIYSLIPPENEGRENFDKWANQEAELIECVLDMDATMMAPLLIYHYWAAERDSSFFENIVQNSEELIVLIEREKNRSETLKSVLKDFYKDQECALAFGREKGREKRQTKAKTNWKVIDEYIEGLFKSGDALRYGWTNQKISERVFKNIGKSQGYKESTIAQRVKTKAAEYRKKYAQN